MSQQNAVYTGTVVKTRDPKGLGRVQVSLPDLGKELWARRVTPAAGDRSGAWFGQDVDDEVLVAFEAGDPRRPVVLGALRTATRRPPDSNPERMLLRTKHGTTLVVDDGAGGVEISDSNGNAVTLSSSGVTVRASAKVTISASTVEIQAAMVEVDAGIAKFSGVVQCDTLIANSVVASSYTPGVGNVS